MVLLQDFLDYIEALCINHPDVQHTADNKVFLPITIEDSFGDFRMGVKEKSFIVRPIIYTAAITANEMAEYAFNKQGGLLIAHYFKNNDYQGYLTAINKSEKLMQEFVSRMIYDSRNGVELWNYSLDNPEDITFQYTPFQGDLTYAGWRMIFTFSPHFSGCVDELDAPIWADIADPPPQTVQRQVLSVMNEDLGYINTIIDE